MNDFIDFSLYAVPEGTDLIGEAAKGFQFKDFTEEKLKRTFVKSFKQKGFEVVSLVKPKRAKKEGGVSRFDVNIAFSNGLTLVLGYTFESKGKKIKPNDQGGVVWAKFGSMEIPLAMQHGQKFTTRKMLGHILPKMKAALPKELKKDQRKKERLAARMSAPPSPESPKGIRTLAVQKKEIETKIDEAKAKQDQLQTDVDIMKGIASGFQTDLDGLRNEDGSLTQQIQAKEKELEELKAA